MLRYCSDKKNEVTHVVIYKVDRMARVLSDYGQIKLFLKKYKVEIISSTEPFDDTPAGRFIENMIANVAQFDNEVRTERSIGGMREASREGRYVWKAPIGYKNIKVAGKSTIQQNEFAPLIRKTFELVASNLVPIEEVRRRMNHEGLLSSRGKIISKSHFFKVLKNELYKGEIVKFGERHKGNFKPIVSKELFEKVQWVLKHRTRRNFHYQMENPDFTLRRFVIHSKTGSKLIGSWCQGRKKKYAYYNFIGKGKCYRKEFLEHKFKNFLNSYSMDNIYLNEFKQQIEYNISSTQKGNQKRVKQLENSIIHLKEQQNLLIKKNLQGVISDDILQEHLGYIERDLNETKLALSDIPQEQFTIKKMVRFISHYLEKPGDVWEVAEPQEKLLLQWFKFPKGVFFDGSDFRTKEICNIFNPKKYFFGSKKLPSALKDTHFEHTRNNKYKKSN